jgi:hypothetical protein
MQRFLNLRLVGKREGIAQDIQGAWYVDPSGPQRAERIEYARKLLAEARQLEPGIDWHLETRGESGAWHRMEE